MTQNAAAPSPLVVLRVPCLSDNYGWVLHCRDTGATALIDTPETAPLLSALDRRGWTLSHILNTHHHYDHAGNNEEIKARTGCTVVGPAMDRDRIPGIDVEVDDGDVVQLGAHHARVFFTPGHTRGHIVYHFEEAGKPRGPDPDSGRRGLLFCGDTLFALGCGRLFEGSPAQMWSSLSRLRELPDDTVVLCAHEYTQANARFALTIEGDNDALLERARQIDLARSQGRATVPFALGLDKATNPFLRADLPSVQRAVGLEGHDPAEVFGEIRGRKDVFGG